MSRWTGFNIWCPTDWAIFYCCGQRHVFPLMFLLFVSHRLLLLMFVLKGRRSRLDQKPFAWLSLSKNYFHLLMIWIRQRRTVMLCWLAWLGHVERHFNHPRDKTRTRQQRHLILMRKLCKSTLGLLTRENWKTIFIQWKIFSLST